MEQWYCFRCKEKMVEDGILMTYLNIATSTVEGIKCPKCSAAYLLEETVVGKVAYTEKMLESK